MQKKIYFSNSKGNKICGILSNPTSETNIPVIILCHGLATAKNSSTNTQLKKIFNNHEIATFRFDFFGYGESEGNFENITISETVDDILNAIKYLKNKGFSKLGLVGSSFSGISSIIVASKTNSLFVLVLKSPISDYYELDTKRRTKKEIEEWKTKGFVILKNDKGENARLNYSFFEDYKNNDAYEAARKIKIPTLIVHGDKDKTIPIKQSKKTASIVENCKLEIITGADHRYSNPGEREKMLNFISKFIIEHI